MVIVYGGPLVLGRISALGFGGCEMASGFVSKLSKCHGHCWPLCGLPRHPVLSRNQSTSTSSHL